MAIYKVDVAAGKVKVESIIGLDKLKDKKYKLVVEADSSEEAESKALLFLYEEEKITRETLDKINGNTSPSEGGESMILNQNYFDNYSIHAYPEPAEKVAIIWESSEF